MPAVADGKYAHMPLNSSPGDDSCRGMIVDGTCDACGLKMEYKSKTLTHHVKCRKKGKKTWKFMTPKGGLNKLRIHAAQFTEENAKKFIEENTPDNPEWEFKAQPIGGAS